MQSTKASAYTTNQDIISGPIFTKKELEKLYKFGANQRELKIRREFKDRISRAPYANMTAYDKYIYCEAQVKAIKEENKGLAVVGLGMILGALVGIILGALVEVTVGGGGEGFLIFLLIMAGGGYAGNQVTKQKSALILPLLEQELIKNKSQHDAEDKAREAIVGEKAFNIFERMLKEPKLITELFPSYREHALQEINQATPDSSAVKSKAALHEFKKEVVAGVFGVYGNSYTPSEDSKFGDLIQILERERSRIKELAHAGAHLPFGAIEHFQETSRTYFGLHREGGNASIYDEQMIQNEVIAMKESLSVSGNYNDHSTRIDRSTSHTTNIQNAVVDNGEYDERRIKKEVLKTIISGDNEASSKAELLASIPVKESRLLAVLEELQHSGLLVIGNRSSGEVVYSLDRLA